MSKLLKNRRRWLIGLPILLFLLSVNSQAALQDGLVAYWAFDENYEDSVGVFNGEPRGAETPEFVESAGPGFGTALRLNGEDQFVEIVGGNEDDLEFPGGDMSISGWFRVAAFDTSWQCIISKGEGTNYRVARRGTTDSIAYAGGVGEPAAAAPDVNDGEWHHFVAISNSATSTQLWVDGILVEETGSAPVLAESDLPLMIGENPGARNREWEGDLDDFAIWNRVLTPGEIGELANNSLGEVIGLNTASIVEGMVAHWNFDDNYNDSVGGFTGEPRGTEPVTFVDGPSGFGKAINLNGEDQFVEITGGNENNLEFPGGDMSISGWFRVAAFDTNWQALLSKGEGTNYRVARRGSTDSVAYAGGVGEPAAAAPNVNDGEWHHFTAITDSSTGTQLWIDGVLAESNDTPPVLGESDFPLMIGENPGARGREWEGQIDDIAIWNRVLTPEEIGELANNSIDNIVNPLPLVRFAGADSLAGGVTIRLKDTPEAILPLDSFNLIIDGVQVGDDKVTATKVDGLNTIEYSTAPDFFPSGSEHVWIVEYTNSEGVTQSIERPFTTPEYGQVSPGFIAEGVDTSSRGFRVFAYATEANNPNSIVWSEEALRGEHGDNQADLTRGPDLDRDGFGDFLNSPATNGFIDETVINYDSLGLNVGDFQDPTFLDPILTDGTIPGFPGFQIRDAGRGNAILEVITYVEFPTRDVYTMGVNSDDGFKVSVAGSNRDVLGQVLGFKDGGGAGRRTFSFLVEEPGIYPMRLLWYNGGGGSNVEWFTVNKNGERVLLNDTDSEGGLAAYYSRSGGERARVTEADGLNALISGGNLNPEQTFEITLVDGTTTVDESSINFTFNGSSDGVTVNKSGSTTTVSFAPDGLLPANEEIQVGFSWSETGGATSSISLAATVSDYATIESFHTAIGTGGVRGFNWRVHQQEAGRGNNTTLAEAQLASGNDTNIATPDTDGDYIYEIDGVINFDQAGGNQGNFQAGSAVPSQQVADALIPGIPGTTGSTDNIAAEVTTFIEFPTAGLYQMVVNSDDGFRVTLATDETTADGTVESLTSAEALELGVFSGGRGAADTAFFFAAKEPGLYPMRLIWYEGGGGANVEWFTVNSDGSRALINGTQPGALKAYRTRSGTPSNFVAPPAPDPDVLRPGNLIVASSDNSPAAEGVANAIDNNVQTKYLNFDAGVENGEQPTGLTVTSSGSVVTGISFTSANDAPERDPATYELSGSTDGGATFTLISEGDVPAFADRFTRVEVMFDNSVGYITYRLMFPTTVGPDQNSMQIAEIQLLGESAKVTPTDPPTSEAGIIIADNGDGTVTLTWEGALQGADAVTGPYADEPGTSPMTIEATESARFYRVQ